MTIRIRLADGTEFCIEMAEKGWTSETVRSYITLAATEAIRVSKEQRR